MFDKNPWPFMFGMLFGNWVWDHWYDSLGEWIVQIGWWVLFVLIYQLIHAAIFQLHVLRIRRRVHRILKTDKWQSYMQDITGRQSRD
jgi:hypothetical protein